MSEPAFVDECDDDVPAELPRRPLDRGESLNDLTDLGGGVGFAWLYCFSSLRMRRARLGRGVRRGSKSGRPRLKFGCVQPE